MILHGMMQEVPLLISSLLEYAAKRHGSREVVSRTVEGHIHRYTYCEASKRAAQLANALVELGVARGERVATVAWNTFRHFEAFYAVSGIGAILHTINPRLFDEQIKYIMQHAEDSVVFVDVPFIPLLERLASDLPSVRHYVVLAERDAVPPNSLSHVLYYEELIAAQSDVFEWPAFDERTASSLCYTSGTTGNPKGVLYSHRSTVLHSLHAAQPSTMNVGPHDAVLVIAPMYHANGWGVPYLAPMVGAKLVLPGPRMDAANIWEMITQEEVTFACAVPTVWGSLLEYVTEKGAKLTPLKRALIAGVAVPQALMERFRDQFGVDVLQFWGMTEMSPLGTIATATPAVDRLSPQERAATMRKQGRIPYGVQMKIVDLTGNEVPSDGTTFGDIFVKGPWIASAYFKGEGGPQLDDGGWFPTGDVGTIDACGFMKITDRAKDLIKSGGEWISSVDLENLAFGHPKVAEAAVVAARHDKWDERPILIVSLKRGEELLPNELIEHLRPHVARWWLPDAVVVLDELPHTATGKILKSELRNRFRDYLLVANRSRS